MAVEGIGALVQILAVQLRELALNSQAGANTPRTGSNGKVAVVEDTFFCAGEEKPPRSFDREGPNDRQAHPDVERLPAPSAARRPEDPFLGSRVERSGVRGVHRHAEDVRVRQAGIDGGPALTAVGALEDAASGASIERGRRRVDRQRLDVVKTSPSCRSMRAPEARGRGVPEARRWSQGPRRRYARPAAWRGIYTMTRPLPLRCC